MWETPEEAQADELRNDLRDEKLNNNRNNRESSYSVLKEFLDSRIVKTV